MEISQIEKDLKKSLPSGLIKALFASYKEIKNNYFLGKHEPSELNGGKFVECCIRILQHQTGKGKFSALGEHIPDIIGKLRKLEQLPNGSVKEAFRTHIPRTLALMYSIRNKRGVGHVGGEINPNEVDSYLVVACADWTMAELFRVFYQCDISEAQLLVNSLSKRPFVLVETFRDVRRVLFPKLSHKDQALALLAAEHPNDVKEKDLISWIEPKNVSRFRRDVLASLHKNRLIEYKNGDSAVITSAGLSYVEGHYRQWIDQASKE